MFPWKSMKILYFGHLSKSSLVNLDKEPERWESIIERERDISHTQNQNLKSSKSIIIY